MLFKKRHRGPLVNHRLPPEHKITIRRHHPIGKRDQNTVLVFIDPDQMRRALRSDRHTGIDGRFYFDGIEDFV